MAVLISECAVFSTCPIIYTNLISTKRSRRLHVEPDADPNILFVTDICAVQLRSRCDPVDRASGKAISPTSNNSGRGGNNWFSIVLSKLTDTYPFTTDTLEDHRIYVQTVGDGCCRSIDTFRTPDSWSMKLGSKYRATRYTSWTTQIS